MAVAKDAALMHHPIEVIGIGADGWDADRPALMRTVFEGPPA